LSSSELRASVEFLENMLGFDEDLATDIVISNLVPGKSKEQKLLRTHDLMRYKNKNVENVEARTEEVYGRIKPNKTGGGMHSLEIRIPKQVRELVGIDDKTELIVKIDSKNRIILEKARPTVVEEISMNAKQERRD